MNAKKTQFMAFNRHVMCRIKPRMEAISKIFDVSWRDHITNKELYGDLPKITTRISIRRLHFAGHCMRSKGRIISELVTWRRTQGRRSAGRPTKTFVDLLHQDTGFTIEIQEIKTSMQDRNL